MTNFMPFVLVTMKKWPTTSSLVAGLQMAAAYIGALGVVGALGEASPRGRAWDYRPQQFLGALVVFAVFPGIVDFVCEPLVPWRISIALFGAFAMSWLATGVALRSPFRLAGLMI
jgi:hypothetical protein